MASNQNNGRFPYKLYSLLEAEASGDSSVVSWRTDGHSFVVHDIDAFTNDVAPRYFQSTKFRSFTRQLNIWGFKTTQLHGWMHPHFIRGIVEDLGHIERIETKGIRTMTLNLSTKRASKTNGHCTDGSRDTRITSHLQGGKFFPSHLAKDTQTSIQEMNLPVSLAPPSPHPIDRGDYDNSSITLADEDDHLLLMSNMIEPQDNAGHCRCSFCIALANID